MHLQATLTLEDLTEAVNNFTPLEISLGDTEGRERSLSVERPERVTLVAGCGLRIETTAHLTWTVAGLPVPVSIKSARPLLLPSVELQGGRDVLRFLLVLEDADLGLVPSFIDAKFVERVNQALLADDARPTWHFLDTLSFSVGLPERLRSARALELTAKWGAVKVTETELLFTVSYRAQVKKTEAAKSTPAPAPTQGAGPG